MKKGMMNTYGAKPKMSGRPVAAKPGAAKMPKMPAKPTMSGRTPTAAKSGVAKPSKMPARMRNR